MALWQPRLPGRQGPRRASPIAARSSGLIIAPDGIEGEGSEGATSFDVTFGYSGAYTPSPHGLDGPSVGHLTLAQDSDSLFDPGSADGTAALRVPGPTGGHALRAVVAV